MIMVVVAVSVLLAVTMIVIVVILIELNDLYIFKKQLVCWLKTFNFLKKLIAWFLQALIYPLTVASKSQSTARHNAANKVLKNMCDHSNTLVQQAMMVGIVKLNKGKGRIKVNFLGISNKGQHRLAFNGIG